MECCCERMGQNIALPTHTQTDTQSLRLVHMTRKKKKTIEWKIAVKMGKTQREFDGY